VPRRAEGHAYLLACPFEIEIAAGDGPICPISVAGRSATVYWPFRNNSEPSSPPRWINLARIPRRPHTEPPHLRAPIPIGTPQPRPGVVAADSLRIDVYGPDAESQSEFVRELALRLLGLMRHRTRQWWIKRPNREGEDLIRNEFAINHRGELAGGVTAGILVEPRRGSEQPLAFGEFKGLCDALASGDEIPLAWDLFYDALFFIMATHGGKDVRRAVIDAANACEVGVLAAASRVGAARNLSARKILNHLRTYDLIFNLRYGIPKLAGRSFLTESPDNYRLVHKLWRHRGSIAHGRLPGVRLGRPLPSLNEFHDMLAGVEAALRWLDGL
jgi:hypothetical protein